MDLHGLFSDDDQRAISEAAQSAELKTSGEIVPYVVGSCDDYAVAAWKGAVLGILVGGAGGYVAHYLGGFWGGSTAQWVVAPAAVLGLAAFVLCGRVPWLKRLVIGGDVLDLRARRRAAAAFLDEEVFATRDRTGILIFIAVFERRVVVMGDSGINRAVPEGAWEGVVADLVEGIRQGRPAAALIDAIAECGRLLEAHRVEIRPDDTNELSNELRLRER